jgi:hypothetical protein
VVAFGKVSQLIYQTLPAEPFNAWFTRQPLSRYWYREVVSPVGGIMKFRVDSEGPFSVTVAVVRLATRSAANLA